MDPAASQAAQAHSLWELLRDTTNPKATAPLSCAECFALMEYLADCAIAGVPPDVIWRAAARHLARCPDCRIENWRRIAQLDSYLEQGERDDGDA